MSTILRSFGFEKARLKEFNYAVGDLNATIVEEKLDPFFNNLISGEQVNLAFDFNSKKLDNGKFQYFYAHENNTLQDRLELV